MWKVPFLRAAAWRGEDFRYAHVKLDGHRTGVFFQPGSSEPVAMTTDDTEITPALRGLPCWVPFEKLIGRVPMTAFDCELWRPGKPASYVKTALKEQDPGLRLTCFAVPCYLGADRYQAELEWAHSVCEFHHVPFVPYCQFTAPPTEEQLLRYVPVSAEGWVLKAANYSGWWKLKPVRTLEAVITGFKDGEGKYLGAVGALLVSVRQCDALDRTPEMIEVAAVSGMDDETRWDIDEKADLGRVCEVAYQYVGSKGRLRHPRFVRWRDDRRAETCTTAQDPQLTEYWG